MIAVEFREEPGGVRLHLRGHAGGGPAGADPVCAAASILAYTAAQNAACLFGDEKLVRAPEIRLEKGEAEVLVEPRAEFYDEALYGFWICQLGYALLARGYPQCLRLRSFADPRGEEESTEAEPEGSFNITHEATCEEQRP